MTIITPWPCPTTRLILIPTAWLLVPLEQWKMDQKDKMEEQFSGFLLDFLFLFFYVYVLLFFSSCKLSRCQEGDFCTGAQTQSDPEENEKLAQHLSDIWPLILNKWVLCTCLSPQLFAFCLFFWLVSVYTWSYKCVCVCTERHHRHCSRWV